MSPVGPLYVSLVPVTVGLAGLALVPSFYHRWWWWDVVMHTAISGLLAVWGRTFDLPSRWAWPLFVGGMLAWEWLELATPLLYSPSRHDVLMDLTVNLVVFWTVWAALSFGFTDDASTTRSLSRFGF